MFLSVDHRKKKNSLGHAPIDYGRIRMHIFDIKRTVLEHPMLYEFCMYVFINVFGQCVALLFTIGFVIFLNIYL